MNKFEEELLQHYTKDEQRLLKIIGKQIRLKELLNKLSGSAKVQLITIVSCEFDEMKVSELAMKINNTPYERLKIVYGEIDVAGTIIIYEKGVDLE